MSDTPKMNKDDISLFRSTVGPVEPIKDDKVLFRPVKPKPIPFKSQEEDQKVIIEMLDGDFDPADLESGEEILFKRAGIQNKVFRKLRSGKYSIEAQLDLHGMTVAMAHNAISLFLMECRNRNRKCIKIVHGKGIGSKDGKPVIKNKVNLWLQRRDDVLAFCSARPNDGGTGAIYVLIKR